MTVVSGKGRYGPLRRSRAVAIAAAVTAVTAMTAALLAACGGTAPAPGPREVSVVRPQPPGAIERAAPLSTTSPAPQRECDRTASLRPAGPPPPAGQMPPGSTMADIVDSGLLRVGVDQNTYPFGFRDSLTGELEGFDVDIARAITKAMFGDARKIQFVTLTSQEREPALQQNRVDIVVRTMTITCARKENVDFSTVYYQAGQRVLVNSDFDFDGLDSLTGKRVCAAAGSTSIDNLINASWRPVPVAVSVWTDCLVMLQQGQVEAISTDDNILAGLAAQDPYTEVVGDPFTEEPYGVAIRKGREDLVRFVNAVLEQVREDGTWAEIYRKWLSELGSVPAPPPARYLP